IGVYALMEVAADLYADAPAGCALDKRYFTAALADFATEFNWSTEGPLRGLGGQGGVKEALALIRATRRPARLRVVANG
ncbi:MAG: DGQHR domain-containing protein, partial [Bradyrhizobium sp.]